jgi:hypothetical protein
MTKEQTPDIFEASKSKQLDYIDAYNGFMDTFRHQEVSGAEVGEMVAKMAQHFIRHNLILVRSLKIYTKIKSEIQSQTDAQTGKAITASKADTLAAATPEAYAYEEAKTHVQNIEQAINALKALQRGVLNEFAYSQ